ncbi:MAG: hypothetical protein U0836_21250 [Pirellulales bacterium]
MNDRRAVRQPSAQACWLCLAIGTLLLTGCPSSGPPKPAPAPSASVKLQVLVVDDPALAAAIGRLQGEWEAQGGGPLEVRQATAAELQTRQELGADVVVFPDTELGWLGDRGWLAALERDVEADSAYQWTDVFPQLRATNVRWGGETLALPLGSRVLLLGKSGAGDGKTAAPATWTDLLALLEAGDPKPRIALPLAKGWAGQALLAWAAPYVRHPDYYSGVFNKDTFETQIASAPFVRALEELCAAAKRGHPRQLELAPEDAWQAVAHGEAEWVIGWPPVSASDAGSAAPAQAIVSAALPGAIEAFNPLRNTWDRAEGGPQPTPLVGLEGRLAGASVSAVDGLAAYRLLALLTGPQWSGEIAPLSPATAPFRGKQISPPIWRPAAPTDAGSYAAAVAASLSSPRALVALRIPGRAEYLAALDTAVQQAVRGEATPQAALEAAAAEWRKITSAHGLEAQRAAYQRSLGLERP